MGKQRRDKFLIRKGLDYKHFLYASLNAMALHNKLLLEVDVQDYGYRIYCPINKEDLAVVTRHEEEIIINFFDPKEGDIVVDVGAHLGRYTLIAASKVKRGHVFAIEAHPRNFRLLCRNIKLNNLTNVTTFERAAYSTKMRLKLFLPDENLGYTMHHSIMSGYLLSKYKQPKLVEKHFVEVSADALDTLLPVQQINWLKIDVEGAELEVLKGAQELVRKSDDLTILVEVHGKDTYMPVVEFFADNNLAVEFEKTYDNGEKHLIAKKRK